MFVLLLDRIIPKSFCFGCPKMSSFNIAFLKGKLFIFVQPLKASLDIFSMLIPPLMLSNFVHPLNAHSSIETRDFGKINSCNAVQFSNVEFCIISMFGIEILYKLGIIGTGLYCGTLVATLSKAKKQIERHLVNYFPLMFFLLMFGFLAGVVNYALPFYIIIVALTFNYTSLASDKNVGVMHD